VAGNEDMSARNQYSEQSLRELVMKLLNFNAFLGSKNGETWHGSSAVAVVGLGQAPYSALAIGSFLKLVRPIFDETVGRISDDRVDGLGATRLQPREGVGMNELIFRLGVSSNFIEIRHLRPLLFLALLLASLLIDR
jgi:hypothetical protein